MRYTGDYAGMFAAVVIVFLPTFILYVFLSEKIISHSWSLSPDHRRSPRSSFAEMPSHP